MLFFIELLMGICLISLGEIEQFYVTSRFWQRSLRPKAFGSKRASEAGISLFEESEVRDEKHQYTQIIWA